MIATQSYTHPRLCVVCSYEHVFLASDQIFPRSENYSLGSLQQFESEKSLLEILFHCIQVTSLAIISDRDHHH